MYPFPCTPTLLHRHSAAAVVKTRMQFLLNRHLTSYPRTPPPPNALPPPPTTALPLLLFFLASEGLKWMEGMAHTSCMGSASLSVEILCSQPAPCRYSPLMYTPSCNTARPLFSSLRHCVCVCVRVYACVCAHIVCVCAHACARVYIGSGAMFDDGYGVF